MPVSSSFFKKLLMI